MKAIKIDAEDWTGKCFLIAVEINRKLKLGWQEQYGFYTGHVEPGGFFPAERPMQRHGWLKTPDGRIFDPTRFVFERAAPYLYCEINEDDYDPGMESYKKSTRGDPPPFFPSYPLYDVTMKDEKAAKLITKLFDNYPSLSFDQLIYLGNMGPIELGVIAKPIYEKIIELGQSAIIPLDYRTAALRGGKYKL